MNIILLGAPGAGKGTQAARICDKYSLPHVSTGDILRKNIADGTPVGKKAASFIDNGRLVPDEVVIEIVAERLSRPDAAKGYLLDGFPRTIAQAAELDKIATIDKVINLEVELGALMERITGRRVCPACGESYHISFKKDGKCDRCGETLVTRADDTPETVEKRVSVYLAQTAPLIDYYGSRGKLVAVNGMGSADEVFARIEEALG